jgi:hypothetical protein
MSYNVEGYNSMHFIVRVVVTLAIHAGKFMAEATALDGSHAFPLRLARGLTSFGEGLRICNMHAQVFS